MSNNLFVAFIDSDQRPEAESAIEELREQGVRWKPVVRDVKRATRVGNFNEQALGDEVMEDVSVLQFRDYDAFERFDLRYGRRVVATTVAAMSSFSIHYDA